MTLTTAQTTQIRDAWAILEVMSSKPVCALVRDQISATMDGDEMIAFGDQIARDGHMKARGEAS